MYTNAILFGLNVFSIFINMASFAFNHLIFSSIVVLHFVELCTSSPSHYESSVKRQCVKYVLIQHNMIIACVIIIFQLLIYN